MIIAAELVVTRPDAADPARADQIANEEIARALGTLSMEFERRVRLLTPVGVLGDGGGLRGSIAGTLRGVPYREAVIGTSSLYGDIVERGRRPGPVSTAGRESIELWIRKKFGVSGYEAHWISFAVAWKIAKKGFPGAHMFQRALDGGRDAIERIWSSVGRRIAERLR